MIVPALALGFHIDLRYAIGASLVSVIATSSGTAVSYVREGFSNVRIGMFLEVATTIGALGGAYLVSAFPPTPSASSLASRCFIPPGPRSTKGRMERRMRGTH